MTQIHLHNLGEDITIKLDERADVGKSAYDLAIDNGFVGTERQWIDSLQGNDGNGFDITKVYGSLIELKADESNPLITEGMFVIINSEDVDNGSLYVKKDGVYMFQANLSGIKGQKGEIGGRGRGVVVKGTKASEGLLPQIAEEGDAWWIDEKLYIWSNNPSEIVMPGFVRGNSLKGSTGSVGQTGKTGSDASVTLTNIKNALGYVPANQETTNSHASLNASKTVKGHMQVGEGLNVTNGVVSVDKSIASKQFLSLGNEGVNLAIGTAPFDIKLATTYLSNGIPYNASTGEFTLTKDKVYKLQFVGSISTTGRLEIRAVTSTGANVSSVYGLWGGTSENKTPNMYSTMIQPSATGKYKLRNTVHSVASSTLSQYTGHLEIIEI